ncbi:MAG: tyrosine-type recombinase/integrase [Vitreoscilla sp.]|nr:tyrosine-type recombinase/integrase [Vitreoscilla sp.]
MTTKITDKAMQGRPAEADLWLSEGFGRGMGTLQGRITPAGERLFYFRYSYAGTQRRQLLGPFSVRGDGTSSFSVAQARTAATSLSLLYRSGTHDLKGHFEHVAQAAAQERSAEMRRQHEEQLRAVQREEAAEAERLRRVSVRALFDRWASTDLAPRLRADGRRLGRRDGGRYTLQQFERRIFPTLGDRPIAEVSKADILTILDAIKAEGKLRTANTLLADLKQMFGFALAREVIQRNPLDVVTKREVGGASVLRSRYLDEAELTRLAAALPSSGLSLRSICAIKLILASGCRVGELYGCTWSDRATDRKLLGEIADSCDVKVGFVNIGARTWELPSTKNQRDHRIHLSDFALLQLQRLAAISDTSPWVFPNSTSTGPVCVKSLGKQLSDRQREPTARMSGRSAATQSLALPGGKWTAHDLRRTSATTMANLGVHGDVIDECLNHVIESTVRRTYVHGRRLPEQALAFDSLGGLLHRIFET